MTSRRNFLRNLAGGLALAMLPFVRELPPERLLITDWFQTSRMQSYCSPEYTAALEKILSMADRQLGIPSSFFS